MAFKVADLLVQVLPERDKPDTCDPASCMFNTACAETRCVDTKCEGETCIMASLCDETQCGCTLTQGTGCAAPTGGGCDPLGGSGTLDLDALRAELRARAPAAV